MNSLNRTINKMDSFARAHPRVYLIALLTFSWVLLYGLMALLASFTAAAKTTGMVPLSNENWVSPVLTTTTPTASVTPTPTPSGTVTATVTVTPSPTSTPTVTPPPTATPTLADLLSYLPAIVNQVSSPTPTPSPTSIPLGIHGYVTLNGVPVGGVFLDLRFYDGSAWSTYGSTITGGDGSYSILNVPSLNPGEAYYIRYINNTDPSRLFTWHTNVIDVYKAGSNLQFETFDISNVYLINPASGSPVELPFTFQWIARPFVPTDNYEFDLFDPEDNDPYFYTTPLGYTSGYQLSGLPDDFEIGKWYGWNIWILPPSGDTFDGYGLSYYFYYVFFVSEGQIISVEVPHIDQKRAGDFPITELNTPTLHP